MSQFNEVLNKKAVALKYDENRNAAPVIVASGMGYLAEKIVEVAKNEATRAYFIEDCDHTFNVFSGDYTAINEAIQAGIDFVKEVFGQEQAPADEAVAER